MDLQAQAMGRAPLWAKRLVDEVMQADRQQGFGALFWKNGFLSRNLVGTGDAAIF